MEMNTYLENWIFKKISCIPALLFERHLWSADEILFTYEIKLSSLHFVVLTVQSLFGAL